MILYHPLLAFHTINNQIQRNSTRLSTPSSPKYQKKKAVAELPIEKKKQLPNTESPRRNAPRRLLLQQRRFDCWRPKLSMETLGEQKTAPRRRRWIPFQGRGEGRRRSRGFPVALSPQFRRSSDTGWERSEWEEGRRRVHIIGSGKWGELTAYASSTWQHIESWARFCPRGRRWRSDSPPMLEKSWLIDWLVVW